MTNNTAWKLHQAPSQRSAEFSSLNFILKYESAENELDSYLFNILYDYLKYAFWSNPKPGFCCSPMTIFSRDNVNYIIKSYKSIYTVKRIHEPHIEILAPFYSAVVQRADIQSNIQGYRSTFSAYIAKDVIDDLIEENEVDSYHGIRDVIVNGLIYDIQDNFYRREGSLKLLSVISDLLSTDIELTKTITAMVAVEQFYELDSFGYIGTVKEIQSAVKIRFDHYRNTIDHGVTVFELLGRPIEQIMPDLYPILIQDKNHIYFVHPTVIAALIEVGLNDQIAKRNVELIIKFVILVEKLHKERHATRLRYTDETTYFKLHNIHFRDLLKVIISAYRDIKLSKLMKAYF